MTTVIKEANLVSLIMGAVYLKRRQKQKLVEDIKALLNKKNQPSRSVRSVGGDGFPPMRLPFR
jgi:hypothetical protein